MDERLADIFLYGELAEKYGEWHAFAVKNPREALAALEANYPGFAADFLATERYGVYCDGDWRDGEQGAVAPAKEMHFVPAVEGGGPTHNDGVQSFADSSGITVRHNNIDMSTTKDGNAAWQDSSPNSVVDNNWLDGGGCTLNFADQGATLTGLVVTNNRFGRHSSFQCPILLSLGVSLATNSVNVWADTGTPIPPPQQHN